MIYMKFTKKYLKFLITAALIPCFAAVSLFSASAATFITYDDYRYAKLSDSALAVESYVGTDSKYYFTVPANPAAGFTTTAVYENFMQDNTDLSTVSLPDTITEIQQMAFNGCTGISSFTMPYNLTAIGANVFQNSGLTSLKFNSFLAEIGESAFSGTGLTSVTFPNTLRTIGMGAFSNCPDLKFVTVPRGVVTIESGAFLNCNKNLVMYGYNNTAAQIYADNNDITFITIDDYTFGDVNGDNDVNVKDATYIQKSLAAFEGFDIPPGTEAFDCADVNCDNSVTVQDATIIQKYISRIILELPYLS